MKLSRALVALLTMTCVLATAARARADEDEPDPRARELTLAAESARAAGLFEQCMEKDDAALAVEERTSTRVHFVGCAEQAGKVLAALRHLQPVLEAAVEEADEDLADVARQRVEQLLQRLAVLTVTIPPNLVELTVTLDGASVQPSSFAKPISVDPGTHRVHAEGLLEGARASFDQVVTLDDGERSTVAVTLKPTAPDYLTPGQLACMQLAKTQEEVMQCLPGRDRPLVVRAALEYSTYYDTFAVRILNPSIRASIASPTKGWNVGASYLIDFVSAASPDIVSTASPRGADTRHGATVNGGYKPGSFGFDAGAAISSESDYVSRSANLALLTDLDEKRITPRIGYAFTDDTIGRGGTSYDVFSHKLLAHEGSAGASFIVSPTTIVVAGITAAFERGDQSKPYRLIPMFAPGVEVSRGASADEVNAKRLPVRPYEQLPLDRNRYSIGGRLNHRFAKATLRIDERLYDDSWSVRSTSTDVRFLWDFGTRLTAGPHVRFHAQTGAVFNQRVYHAETSPSLALPVYRTTDRELSPLASTTTGLAAWWKLTDAHKGVGLMLYASADSLYSVYFDSIYAKDRWAGYGTVGIEAELE